MKKHVSEAERLSCDSVDMKPIAVDWTAVAKSPENQDGDPWFWEAVECESCHKSIVVTRYTDEPHRDVEPDPDTYGDDDAPVCRGVVCGGEGPQMDYLYPVGSIRTDEDAAVAAAKLTGSLCVARVGDQYGLALTGGGMDMSWDICAAFVELGLYPPVHFAEVPAMAGLRLDQKTARILDACEESCRIMRGWAVQKRRRIAKMRRDLLAKINVSSNGR